MSKRFWWAAKFACCGDVESNPGPLSVGQCLLCPSDPFSPSEDFKLSASIFKSLPRLLNCPEPCLDAFASPRNHNLPLFWCCHQDAFHLSWLLVEPIWANPPFSLLKRVAKHLRRFGGHMILLCPRCHPNFPCVCDLCQSCCCLPRNTPLYLKNGWDLVPPPL